VSAGDAAIEAFCKELRPNKNGCVTTEQQRVLYPLARALLDARRPSTKVQQLTQLGWRAMKVVRALRRDKDGKVFLPTRKVRKDRRVADAEWARNWWIESARTDPSVRNSVVNPERRRRKGKPAERENILWVRGTFVSLYTEYAADALANADGTPGYTVPSYSFFMACKPFNIRKERAAVCVCTVCLQTDLLAGTLKEMALSHSQNHPGCACNTHFRLISTAHGARETLLCERAPAGDGKFRPMHNISCVNGTCDRCGSANTFSMADTCPVASPPEDDAEQPPAKQQVVLCPAIFRSPTTLLVEPGDDSEQRVEIDDCENCRLPCSPIDTGTDSRTGRILHGHCRCNVVTVPLLKKVTYKNKEGLFKDRVEFVDVEATPDDVWLRFNNMMPEYNQHRDKAAVQDAEHRQFADDVQQHMPVSAREDIGRRRGL